MTEQEAIDFCKNNPESAAKIIMMVERLEARIEAQDIEIKELKARLNMNSRNSSKPPSTDNKLNKDRTKKNSDVEKKKRGGQVGHQGSNLKLSKTPDIINILSSSTCSCCNSSLDHVESSKVEKRQVYDFPEIKIEITEHQLHTKQCENCQTINKPEFPDNVNAPTQYGNRIKAFVSYSSTYQMLPYGRIAELIEDLVSHKISDGTIYNFLAQEYNKLEEFENILKQKLLKEDVLHSDETGINIKGKLHWIHLTSSSILTYYMLHQKRGKKAMDDMEILPSYDGILVHDHWQPYNHYECTHSYCNAHILRELNGIIEKEDNEWSKDMHTLLTNMNIAVHKAKDEGKNQLLKEEIESFTKKYENICKIAKECYPAPEKPIKKARGRPKQEKGKNLLDRLSKYKEETLRFVNDFRVPFTNNQAERDLRMIKVKEKISGTFASFNGGEIFCRIKSYISTLKKNNFPILKGLRDALDGNFHVPVESTC